MISAVKSTIILVDKIAVFSYNTTVPTVKLKGTAFCLKK